MFAKRLKELRSEKGVVQKDVANFLNITTSAYGFYEQGKRIPDTDIIIKLSDYFNVSLDYLLGKTDVKKPTDSEEAIITLQSDVDYDDLPNEDKILQKLDQMQNKIDSIEAITTDTHLKNKQSEEDVLKELAKYISSKNELTNIFIPFLSNLINDSAFLEIFSICMKINYESNNRDKFYTQLSGLTFTEFSQLYKTILFSIRDIMIDRQNTPISDEQLFLKLTCDESKK